MAAEFGVLSVHYLKQAQIHFAMYVLGLADLTRLQYHVSRYTNSRLLPHSSVSNGLGLPGCGPWLKPVQMVGSGMLPGQLGYPVGSGTGLNWTTVPLCGSHNFSSNWACEFSSYRNMIDKCNVQIDAPVHLPFSDWWSHQYALGYIDIKSNISSEWAGLHRDSTTIDLIANQIMGDEIHHRTAYSTYTLYRHTMRTPIPNSSKKRWPLRSGFHVGTHCNCLGPGWIQTRNRIRNLDPLLTIPHREFAELINPHNTSSDCFRYLLAPGKPMKRLRLVISQGK